MDGHLQHVDRLGLDYPHVFRIISNWSWSLIIILNWSGHTGIKLYNVREG